MFSSTLPNPFLAWEGEATPVNMFSSTLPNPFIAWEGEAPAEPLCHKLGRSLALPLVFRWFDMGERCLERWGEAPAEPLRRKLGRSLALPLISN